MGIRDNDKEKTAKKFRAAIQRIQDGNYQSPKLRKRKKVKLNQNTVEIEAGQSVGSMRHHGDILSEIEEINNPKTSEIETDNCYEGVTDDELRLENKKLLKRNKKLIKERNEFGSKNQDKQKEIDRIKQEYQSLLELYSQVTSAFFDLIPADERTRLFEKVERRNGNNVTPIK